MTQHIAKSASLDIILYKDRSGVPSDGPKCLRLGRSNIKPSDEKITDLIIELNNDSYIVSVMPDKLLILNKSSDAGFQFSHSEIIELVQKNAINNDTPPNDNQALERGVLAADDAILDDDQFLEKLLGYLEQKP
ncbi:hypothetical protein AB6D11_02605 [Vibrio splendidus]